MNESNSSKEYQTQLDYRADSSLISRLNHPENRDLYVSIIQFRDKFSSLDSCIGYLRKKMNQKG